MAGETWFCTFCKYKTGNQTSMEGHYKERHSIPVASFFFCWLCQIMTPQRDGMWSHLTAAHEMPDDLRKEDLARGLFRPKNRKRRAPRTEGPATKRRATEGPATERRAPSYSKELGPVPQFSLEEADANNNTAPSRLEVVTEEATTSAVTRTPRCETTDCETPRVASPRRERPHVEILRTETPEKTPETTRVVKMRSPPKSMTMDRGASPVTSPNPVPERSETSEKERIVFVLTPEVVCPREPVRVSTPEPAQDDTPVTKDDATQTPSLEAPSGWDHNHTITREERTNGTVITTEMYVWRVGRGSVRFPCCKGPAETFDAGSK